MFSFSARNKKKAQKQPARKRRENMETSSMSKTPHKTPKRFVFGVKKSARVIRWYSSYRIRHTAFAGFFRRCAFPGFLLPGFVLCRRFLPFPGCRAFCRKRNLPALAVAAADSRLLPAVCGVRSHRRWHLLILK